MAVYLIFYNGKLHAHTNNKKTLKRFLKEREAKYYVQEMDEKSISPELKEEYDFALKQLDYYHEFDLLMTEEELMYVFHIAQVRLQNLLAITNKLKPQLDAIKFKGEENVVMAQFLDFLKMMEEDLDGEYESNVFLSDYFDIKSIIDILIR